MALKIKGQGQMLPRSNNRKCHSTHSYKVSSTSDQ